MPQSSNRLRRPRSLLGAPDNKVVPVPEPQNQSSPVHQDRGAYWWAIGFTLVGFIVGGLAWWLRDNLTANSFFVSSSGAIAQAAPSTTTSSSHPTVSAVYDGVNVFTAGSPDAESEAKFDLAVQAVNDGNWTLAEGRLLDYASAYPGRPMADYLLGFVRRRGGDRDGAMKSYVKFLAEEKLGHSKYRFDAAIELAYLSSQVKNGCTEYSDLLTPLLRDSEGELDALGDSYSVRVGKAWKDYQQCMKVERSRNH